jgi:hypothetical protein
MLVAVQATFARDDELKTPKAPNTPEAVVASFIAEVSALSGKYPELADFPDYVKESKKKLADEAKKNAELRAVVFVRNMSEINTKRVARPSDFGKNGIYLLFDVAEAGDERVAEIHTITELKHLKLNLFADSCLSETPSPGLMEKLADIEKRHKAMLVELNKKAAK